MAIKYSTSLRSTNGYLTSTGVCVTPGSIVSNIFVHCGISMEAGALGVAEWLSAGNKSLLHSHHRSSSLARFANSGAIQRGIPVFPLAFANTERILWAAPRHGNGLTHRNHAVSVIKRPHCLVRRSSFMYGHIWKYIKLSAPSPDSTARQCAPIMAYCSNMPADSGLSAGSGRRYLAS